MLAGRVGFSKCPTRLEVLSGLQLPHCHRGLYVQCLHYMRSCLPDHVISVLQVIEFESSPLLMVGHTLGLRVSLIAYPVVSIKKVGSLS